MALKNTTQMDRNPGLHTNNQAVNNHFGGSLEFFLNGAELSVNSANSGKLITTEAWIGLNLKILSLARVLLVLWYHPGFSHKRWLCGRFEPFYCNDKFFVTEFVRSRLCKFHCRCCQTSRERWDLTRWMIGVSLHTETRASQLNWSVWKQSCMEDSI